jgi:hypothetical protein
MREYFSLYVVVDGVSVIGSLPPVNSNVSTIGVDCVIWQGSALQASLHSNSWWRDESDWIEGRSNGSFLGNYFSYQTNILVII